MICATTHARLLFEAGYTIEQVALVSGHRDWNMLRQYTKLKPESLHRPAPAEPTTNVVALHWLASRVKGGRSGVCTLPGRPCLRRVEGPAHDQEESNRTSRSWCRRILGARLNGTGHGRVRPAAAGVHRAARHPAHRSSRRVTSRLRRPRGQGRRSQNGEGGSARQTARLRRSRKRSSCTAAGAPPRLVPSDGREHARRGPWAAGPRRLKPPAQVREWIAVC